MGTTYTQPSSCCSSISGKNLNSSNTFQLKRNDTLPSFTIQASISGGKCSVSNRISFEDWGVKTNMYFTSYLGNAIDNSMEYEAQFTLKGNCNLCLVKIGDIIKVEDCDQNELEYMLVTDFDYATKTVYAERGHLNTSPYSHTRGDKLIFYRIFEQDGYIDSEYIDDPDTTEDESDFSIIGYQWQNGDTTHSGNYYLEFKLTDPTNSFHRSFPIDENGDYHIQIL